MRSLEIGIAKLVTAAVIGEGQGKIRFTLVGIVDFLHIGHGGLIGNSAPVKIADQSAVREFLYFRNSDGRRGRFGKKGQSGCWLRWRDNRRRPAGEIEACQPI